MLRIGDEWYRVDLLFFHRKLRSLVVIDLKLGRFTHADVGKCPPLSQLRERALGSGGREPACGFVILCARRMSWLPTTRWRACLTSPSKRVHDGVAI